MEEKDVVRLLVEIRDLHREHLEEYRRNAQESLEMQRQAGREQVRLLRIYRRIVAVGCLAIVAGVAFLIWGLGGHR